MKLKQALEIGKECGLATVGEAILNIRNHAMSIFTYGEEQLEFDELVGDFKELGFDLEDKVIDCLKLL